MLCGIILVACTWRFVAIDSMQTVGHNEIYIIVHVVPVHFNSVVIIFESEWLATSNRQTQATAKIP